MTPDPPIPAWKIRSAKAQAAWSEPAEGIASMAIRVTDTHNSETMAEIKRYFRADIIDAMGGLNAMAALPLMPWPALRIEQDCLDNLKASDANAPIMRGLTPNGRGFIAMRFPNAYKLFILYAHYPYHNPQDTHWTVNHADYSEKEKPDDKTLDVDDRQDCMPVIGFGGPLGDQYFGYEKYW